MINFDDVAGENIKEHQLTFNSRIIGDSGSGQTIALLNLRNHLHDIFKIYLYAKDLYEVKYNC